MPATARVNERSQQRVIDYPDEPGTGNVSLTSRLRDAIEACRMQQKAAAIIQGYDPAYWSRIHSGEKRAHLDPVASLPMDIQIAFVTAWASQLGLSMVHIDPHAEACEALVTAAVRYLKLSVLPRKAGKPVKVIA